MDQVELKKMWHAWSDRENLKRIHANNILFYKNKSKVLTGRDIMEK